MSGIDYQEYEKLVKEIEDLSKLKNKAYGCDGLIAFGDMGVIVRLFDKMGRIKNLYEQKKSKNGDESIDDSLKDMVNYCLYAILIRRNKLIKNRGD